MATFPSRPTRRLGPRRTLDLVHCPAAASAGDQLYVLFWIEVGSRRVHLAGCTYDPTGTWVVRQARNLAWMLQDGELSASFLLRDRDSKFTAAFDEVLRSEGVRVIRLPYRSPRANSTTC